MQRQSRSRFVIGFRLMKLHAFALMALAFSSGDLVLAATRIDDPKNFVTDIYRRLGTESRVSSYMPPEDIYTPRLSKLFQEDRRRSKHEVGCVDFVFWVNGQDWTITNVAVSTAENCPQQKTVIAKFQNMGKSQEIRFTFLRDAGRWLLDVQPTPDGNYLSF
jgi:hypothetical protein